MPEDPRAAEVVPGGTVTDAGVDAARRRERVLAVLKETPGFAATAMMEDYLEGPSDRDVLTYEDWASPVKASAGRICLVAPLEAGTIWWTMNRSDWLVARCDGRYETRDVEGPEAVGMLRAAMQLDVLEPVHRSETPFQEAEG